MIYLENHNADEHLSFSGKQWNVGKINNHVFFFINATQTLVRWSSVCLEGGLARRLLTHRK